MVTGPAPGGVRLESVMVRIGAKAKFDSFALVAGIGLVRRQMFVRFEGAEAETSLSGVSLLQAAANMPIRPCSSSTWRQAA